MKLNYVIWAAKNVPNTAVLDGLKSVEDKWELKEGVPRAANFTEDGTFRMNPDRPYNTLLTDNLRNIDMLIVASRRLKEFLEQWDLEKVEYLPITILDHKGKPTRDSHFIIHPIEPISLLNPAKCGATWDRLNEGFIKYVERLVIDERLIDQEKHLIKVDRKLFRPKEFYRITLVRRDLAEAIEAAGFTGVQWIELDKYSNA